jgi:hypothetical protein
MIHQHLSDAANRWLDWLAILFAGVSAVSLIQGVAVVVRIHDRIRYGRGQ